MENTNKKEKLEELINDNRIHIPKKMKMENYIKKYILKKIRKIMY